MNNNELEPGRRRPPMSFVAPPRVPQIKVYALPNMGPPPVDPITGAVAPPTEAPAARVDFMATEIVLPAGPVDLNTFLAMAEAVRHDWRRYIYGE